MSMSEHTAKAIDQSAWEAEDYARCKVEVVALRAAVRDLAEIGQIILEAAFHCDEERHGLDCSCSQAYEDMQRTLHHQAQTIARSKESPDV